MVNCTRAPTIARDPQPALAGLHAFLKEKDIDNEGTFHTGLPMVWDSVEVSDLSVWASTENGCTARALADDPVGGSPEVRERHIMLSAVAIDEGQLYYCIASHP